MAKDSIKIKSQLKGDVANVKTLISHEMETGLRKDKKTNQMIPAHFIQEVVCEHNGKNVMTALWGRAVSKNPYLSFNVKGAKAGDTIKISWVDSKGDTDTASETVS